MRLHTRKDWWSWLVLTQLQQETSALTDTDGLLVSFGGPDAITAEHQCTYIHGWIGGLLRLS